MTFSGGEPLAQPDFLLALLATCKDKEIHTAVDTSGFAPWQTLQRISPCVDLVLYDLKLMDDERHRRFIGVSNELILSNLRALSAQGKTMVVRVPIIPSVNDDDENITRIGEFVAALPRVPPVSLLPYHKAGVDKYARLKMPYVLPEIQSPADERMVELAIALKGFGLAVRIGG